MIGRSCEIFRYRLIDDKVISVRRPDLSVLDKKQKLCKTVDFAIPQDARVELSQNEKFEK